MGAGARHGAAIRCGAGWCATTCCANWSTPIASSPGAEAAGFGLVTHVDADPLARATAIASEIANRNPDAIRAAKRLAAAMHEQDNDALLLAESREQQAIIRTPNQMEAVMAGMQKRPAKFVEAA